MTEKKEKISRSNPLKELLLNTSLVPSWLRDGAADTDGEKVKIKKEKLKEGRKVVKRGVTQTLYTKITINGGKSCEAIDNVDLAIITILDSELATDNRFITFERLYKDLGGGGKLTAKVRAMLDARIKGLMSTLIEIDCSPVAEAFYPDAPTKIITANAIDVELVRGKIGRREVDVIKVKDFSPLYKYADIKGQFARVPAEITDANLKLSKDNLSFFWGLLDATARIVHSNSDKRGKRAKPLNKTITFETLLNKCGIKPADRKGFMRLREYAARILDHFKGLNLISGYSIEKRKSDFVINLDLTTNSAS